MYQGRDLDQFGDPSEWGEEEEEEPRVPEAEILRSAVPPSEVAELLENGEIIGNPEPIRGGMNRKFLLTLADGRKAIFKPRSGEVWVSDNFSVEIGTYYMHEIAASLIDRALGLNLVPATVLRDVNGEIGSIQDYRPNTMRGETLTPEQKESIRDDLIKMWLFDYVMWNSDRRPANFLVEDDRVVAIDHGLGFVGDQELFLKEFYDEPIPAEISEAFIRLTQDDEAMRKLKQGLNELILNLDECIDRIYNVSAILQEPKFNGTIPLRELGTLSYDGGNWRKYDRRNLRAA